MLSNIQRLRISAGVLVLLVFLAGISLSISAGHKLDDVRILNQTRTLSYTLELYKQQYLRYPEANGVDLRSYFIITEKGFAPGSQRYFEGPMISYRPVLYSGSEKAYTLSFQLHRPWPDQGLAGRYCRITNEYTLTCSDTR